MSSCLTVFWGFGGNIALTFVVGGVHGARNGAGVVCYTPSFKVIIGKAFITAIGHWSVLQRAFVVTSAVNTTGIGLCRFLRQTWICFKGTTMHNKLLFINRMIEIGQKQSNKNSKSNTSKYKSNDKKKTFKFS